MEDVAAAGEDPEQPEAQAPEGSAPEPGRWLAKLRQALREGFAAKESGSTRLWR